MPPLIIFAAETDRDWPAIRFILVRSWKIIHNGILPIHIPRWCASCCC